MERRMGTLVFLLFLSVIEQLAAATQSNNAFIDKSKTVVPGTAVASQNAFICGACYSIRGTGRAASFKAGSSVNVTITGFYTPNFASNNNGSSSNTQHLLLSRSDFEDIFYPDEANGLGEYSRCPCKVNGGIVFEMISGHKYTEILITNVGAGGNLNGVSVKGSKIGLLRMLSDRCGHWKAPFNLDGQSLSLHLIDGYNRPWVFPNLIPADWKSDNKYISPHNI